MHRSGMSLLPVRTGILETLWDPFPRDFGLTVNKWVIPFVYLLCNLSLSASRDTR